MPEANEAPKTDAEILSLLREIKEAGSKGPDASKVADLTGDNFKLRRKLAEARRGAVPEGAVVLSGDEAKAWAKYREIDPDPSNLRKRVEAGEAAVGEASGFRKAEVGREAAALMGYRENLFSKLARADGLDLVIVDQQKDGKAVRVPHVKGEGDKTTPLADYAEAHWKEELPLLAADTDKRSPRTTTPAPFRGENVPDPRRDTDPLTNERAAQAATGRYPSLA